MRAQRPNILVVMTDQQQADVVHPDHPCRTPNATRLADEGVLFDSLYCPTAHCCPSRATFMTGLYPSRHGVFNNVCNPAAINTGLDAGVRTFSEDLREAGYELFYSGKWHVSAEEGPADRGWREGVVNCVPGVCYHHRSWESWEEFAGRPEPDAPRGRGQIIRPGWHHYQLYGSRPDSGPKGYEGLGDYKSAVSGMEAIGELAKGDAPWMAYIGLVGPHDPFIVPERFVRKVDPAAIDLPPSFPDTMADKPRVYQRMRRMYWGQLGADEVRDSIAHYWAYCTMLDEMLGQVLDALDATGQADNTVVIFTSDHGDYVGAHGLYCKGVPAFREAYNVPMIVRWPAGLRNAGRQVSEFISMADFAPTFLELAGCSAPSGLTGRSWLGFLGDNAPSDWREEIFTQLNGVELYYTQRTVRTKKWKYVYNGFDFDELYDLAADPHETVNLADPARYPQPELNVGVMEATGAYRPWPRLTPELEEARRDLLGRLWRFARDQDDSACNPYATVCLSPFGPGDAL